MTANTGISSGTYTSDLMLGVVLAGGYRSPERGASAYTRAREIEQPGTAVERGHNKDQATLEIRGAQHTPTAGVRV